MRQALLLQAENGGDSRTGGFSLQQLKIRADPPLGLEGRRRVRRGNGGRGGAGILWKAGRQEEIYMPQEDTRKTAVQGEVDRLVRILREEIYSGLRLPRERLVENELAGLFSVSRMVVRQALGQLESEGLVTIEPYKGASVATISIDRIYEGYEILAMLEGFAAKLAVGRLRQKDLEGLETLVEKQRRLDAENVREWEQLNREFHKTINLRCGNQRLIRLIQEHVQFTSYWFIFLSIPGRIHKNIEEHEAVITALAAGDSEGARRRMENHILDSGRYLTAHLEKTMPKGMLRPS
jgi:DNA-binding GntR family transcriptional regulator